MMRISIPWWTLPIAYVVAGLLTAAYANKHDTNVCGTKDSFSCGPTTMMSGFAWPLYWGWNVAMKAIP